MPHSWGPKDRVRNQGPKPNYLDKSTVIMMTSGNAVEEDTTGDKRRKTLSTNDPSLCKIMAAIQDFRGTIEPKLDAVINLLQADFRKITDKVTVAETQIYGLQSQKT
ncbi:hypothetical protein NDU88_006668 [Pleurodeles waltl]|uniref:Uncharacterized protein n=1 Tax=Pleurodeles waltl TaxID=8319 RepID=A0AAV7VNE2_PLEWA|nr:hypothetical protein NDU88_006668 [Pleurodeles waltl]